MPASSFFAWRRKLAGGSAREFVEVAVAQRVDDATDADGEGGGGGRGGGRGGGVTIELGGGRHRVTVTRPFDRQLLADVIDALQGNPSILERRP